MTNVSRRDFLKMATVAAAGLPLFGCVTTGSTGEGPTPAVDMERRALENKVIAMEDWKRMGDFGPEQFNVVADYVDRVKSDQAMYDAVLKYNGGKEGAIEPLNAFLSQDGLNMRVLMGVEANLVNGADVNGPEGGLRSQFVQLGTASYRGPRENPSEILTLDTPYGKFADIVCFNQVLDLVQKSNDDYFAPGVIPIDAARAVHGERDRIDSGFVVMDNKAAFLTSHLLNTGHIEEVQAANVQAVPGAGYGIVKSGTYKGHHATPATIIVDGEPFQTRAGYVVDVKSMNPGRANLNVESLTNMYAGKLDLRDGIGFGRVYFGMGRAPKE